MAFSYLDHNAGTALAPGVLDVMLPYLKQQQGNPSSSHRFGRFGHAALDKARAQVAKLVNVNIDQVWFSSGGTESNNQALMGVAEQFKNGRVLVSSIEHPAVLEPAKRLRQFGFEVLEIPANASGQITPEALLPLLTEDTRLVSVMWANNETGVIQDIAGLTALTREKNIPFHTDAVQAAGKLAVDFQAAGVQMLSLSAHKFGGPKGIGVLIVDKKLDWPAFVLGGGQENDKRSGTENVAAIAGFGAAAEYAQRHLDDYQTHCRQLRDALEAELKSMAGVTIFAENSERLPNTVFFALAGFDSDTLLMALDRQGFSVSSGSACGTGRQIPSHVLTAMGIDAATALGAVRISVSMDNTLEQIQQLAVVLNKEASRFNHLMNR
jgi:cysteine desulfurase